MKFVDHSLAGLLMKSTSKQMPKLAIDIVSHLFFLSALVFINVVRVSNNILHVNTIFLLFNKA